MGKHLTHGSLFAGIGGFEMSARECGIKTLFNCEIDPYCRLVLKARFPEAVQYGDICKLNGAEIPPVDMVTFGSPCQSFSVASATRKGLEGASGLFFQAARVIREMREATNQVYPKYAVMENVPGIYSSKSGGKSDFGVVLNELIKICGETVAVPEPKSGKWLTAGCIVGDGYSLAWRTICASKFGVPQRRRRMYLAVSFDDERAAEILSEQEGKNRNFTPGYLKRQEAAGSVADSSGVVAFEPGAASRIGNHIYTDKVGALRAHAGDNLPAVVYDARGNGNGEIVHTITGDHENRVTDYTALCVMDERQHAATISTEVANSLVSTQYKGAQCVFEQRAAAFMGGQGEKAGSIAYSEEVSPTIRGQAGGNSVPMVMTAYGICSQNSNSMRSGNPESGVYEMETSRTLDTGAGTGNGGMVIAEHTTEGDKIPVCYQEKVNALCASDFKFPQNQQIDDGKAVVETFGNNGYGKWNSEPAAIKASGGEFPGGENVVVENKYAVRRLTPIECLRLQGLPDGHLSGIHIAESTESDIDYWYDVWETNRKALGKSTKPKSRKQIAKWLKNPYSDANAYKSIGNSLAVPCALFVMRGIVEAESNGEMESIIT